MDAIALCPMTRDKNIIEDIKSKIKQTEENSIKLR